MFSFRNCFVNFSVNRLSFRGNLSFGIKIVYSLVKISEKWSIVFCSGSKRSFYRFYPHPLLLFPGNILMIKYYKTLRECLYLRVEIVVGVDPIHVKKNWMNTIGRNT